MLARPDTLTDRNDDSLVMTNWLFPELERFDGKSARQEAMRRAWKQLAWNRMNLALLPLAILVVVAVAVVLLILVRTVVDLPPVVFGGVVGGISGGAASLCMQWLLRMPIRRQLRAELTRAGKPTCLGCGYDLRGNVLEQADNTPDTNPCTTRCPECGSDSPTRLPDQSEAD